MFEKFKKLENVDTLLALFNIPTPDLQDGRGGGSRVASRSRHAWHYARHCDHRRHPHNTRSHYKLPFAP